MSVHGRALSRSAQRDPVPASQLLRSLILPSECTEFVVVSLKQGPEEQRIRDRDVHVSR